MTKVFIVCLLALTSGSSATAQIAYQSRKEAVQAEWERMSPKVLLCVDDRLRRTRLSVNRLIDRRVEPSDTRLAGIVRDCGAEVPTSADNATPSFACSAATYADEKTICGNPELAQLDRAVGQAYESVMARRGSRVAKNISEPLLERRHACDANSECIKQTQLAAIAAFQSRGASPQMSFAPVDAGRADPAYAVDDFQLGSVVADIQRLRDFECTPSRQYSGLTACRRQKTEGTRRRRTSVSTSLLNAADGSTVYVGQSVEPVYIGNDEADDEIARLTSSFGKASLLPMSDSRRAQNGIIASWGAVTLRPIESERLASLSAGTDDRPGLLIDHIGNPQKSAQSGLPVYEIEGGRGYVWTASWGRRGRGVLRMIAIDASRLSGVEAAGVKAPPQTTVAVMTAAGPQDGTAAPAAPPLAAAELAAPAPSASPLAPVQALAAQPDAPAPVRVVGPPIDLRPSAQKNTAMPTATPSFLRDGNALVMLLTAVIVALLGTVIYMFRRLRANRSSVVSTAPMGAAEMPATEATAARPPTPAKGVTASRGDRMDLVALVPGVSPHTITASNAAMVEPPALGPASGI